MIVSEITSLFRQYIDEPDQTFITDAMAATMLAQAYREFQWTVLQVDESIYTTNATLSLAGVASYDLADPGNALRVFGADANLTQPRMLKLVSLCTTNSDGTTNTPMTPVTTRGSLLETSDAFFLDNTFLRFGNAMTVDLQLTYFPEPTATGAVPGPGAGYVDWSTGTSFVDNLSLFHDVIALLAAKQYFILDGVINEPLLFQLQERSSALTEYLNTRNYNGAQYVSQVRTSHQFM